MNTVELYVGHNRGIVKVIQDLKNSGAKFYPINRVDGGWRIELEDHPIVSYLILKYDLTTIH